MHKNLEIIHKQNKPYGIRDSGGFLFFFTHITKYPGQEDRYVDEVFAQHGLADFLLKALQGRSASPALLDELDEILATGCGILGKIGRLKEIARQLRAGNKKGAPLCPKCNSSYTVQIASPFGCDNCGHTW